MSFVIFFFFLIISHKITTTNNMALSFTSTHHHPLLECSWARTPCAPLQVTLTSAIPVGNTWRRRRSPPPHPTTPPTMITGASHYYDHSYLFGDLGAGFARTVSSPSPARLLRLDLLCRPPHTHTPHHPHTHLPTKWFHAGASWLIILKGFVALSRACVLKTYISLTNCGV